MKKPFNDIIGEVPKARTLQDIVNAEPGYRCSDELATLLENLRNAQKGFFAAKQGTLQRQNHLRESKRLEKELDAFLQRRQAEKADTQTKLF